MWPGPDKAGSRFATFEDRVAAPEPPGDSTGPWAWFRLIDAARLRTRAARDRSRLRAHAFRRSTTRPRSRSKRRSDEQSVRAHGLAAVQLRILIRAELADRRAADASCVGRPVEVGFFGKLPSHGDFLRRRVSDAFVDAWDAWLRECLAASRAALGERWLDVYLTSPAWRFVCAAGRLRPGAGHRVDGAQRRPRRPLFPVDARRRAARRRQPDRGGDRHRRRSSTAPSVCSSRRSRPSDVDFERFDGAGRRAGR